MLTNWSNNQKAENLITQRRGDRGENLSIRLKPWVCSASSAPPRESVKVVD